MFVLYRSLVVRAHDYLHLGSGPSFSVSMSIQDSDRTVLATIFLPRPNLSRQMRLAAGNAAIIVQKLYFVDFIIEACIANEQKATNGSLDFQAFGFPKRSLLMQVSIRR